MADRNQLLNDPEEAMRTVLDGRQATMWTALPGIITAVDFSKMVVSVQPSIQGTVEKIDGTIESVNLPLLINVPICFPSAGGFTITFPIASGDEVLVVFSSRCIDSWWQSGGIGRPMEARMHDLSDGFAIPGPKSLPEVVGSISTTAVQIRNDAGTSYVEIAANGKIKLLAPAEINIVAPLVNVTGALVVSGAFTAASLATSGGGSATIGGGIAVTGAITGASVTAGGINLATHIHSGVTVGAGNTGAPVP